MVDGITRHDEEQILTRGEFRLPLTFTALVQGISRHRASTTQRECQQKSVMAGRLGPRISAGSGPAMTRFVRNLRSVGARGFTPRGAVLPEMRESLLCGVVRITRVLQSKVPTA
jgi:hypothetical protein